MFNNPFGMIDSLLLNGIVFNALLCDTGFKENKYYTIKLNTVELLYFNYDVSTLTFTELGSSEISSLLSTS